jgi:hypothetical protein
MAANLEMPQVKLDTLKTTLTAAQMEIVMGVVAKRGDVQRLRASKPAKESGSVQYVWRMVAFMVSPHSQHHCMPVGADFYVTDSEYRHRTDKYVPRAETEHDRETVSKWDAKTWERMHRGEQRRNYIKQELDPIVDAIVDTIPKNQWRGVHRWHQAIYG